MATSTDQRITVADTQRIDSSTPLRSATGASAAEAAIVELTAAQPKREWRTSDLVRAFPHIDVLDVVIAVMSMHRTGRLARIRVATYRYAQAPAAETAARNEQLLWGGDAG